MIDRIGLELVLARGKGSKSQSKVRRLTLCQNPINIGIKTLWHVLTRIKLCFHTPVLFVTNAHLTYYFVSKIESQIRQVKYRYVKNISHS